MQDKLLPLKAVIDHVGLGRTKIYDMISKGQFPRPVKIGAASRWRQSHVQGWIEEQSTEVA